MLFETLILEKKDNISIIRINRLKALNSINIKVLNELLYAFKEVENDNNQKVLIITGEGKKSFAAGADISEMRSISQIEAKKFSQLGHKTFDFIGKMKIPVIAAVNGFALGGGFELALACDFIYASRNAVFGLVETSLGIIPGFGGIARLRRIVGLAKASELIFSAKKINANDAFSLGLVNKVVLDDVLLESIICAKKIVLQASRAISMCKKLLQLETIYAKASIQTQRYNPQSDTKLKK